MKRLNRCICLILCAALTSGCASMSGNDAVGEGVSDNELDGLYNGEPEVVFATEFPVASAEEAVARADSALSQGKTDLALYMYVRAYDMQKDNLYALMRIGGIHESRGNNKMAMRAFTTAVHVDPTNAEALQSLGLIYLHAKHHDEAQNLLERAVDGNPALWRAQNGIGVIADIRGEHNKAIIAYEAALDVNPSASSTLNNRGYSYYLNGQYVEATQDFIAAADMGVERAWLNLGLVLARQKKYPEAVHRMTRIVAPEVAYNDVGYIAMRQGDFGLAESYFLKAIQVSPRYFEEAQRNLTQLANKIAGDNSADHLVSSSEAG